MDARAMCRKVARTELRNDTVSVPVRPNPTPQDPDAVTLPRVSISRDSQLATPLTRSRSSRQPWTRCRMYLVRPRLIIVTPSAFPCTLAKKCSSYTALMADLARQTTTLFLRVVPSPCSFNCNHYGTDGSFYCTAILKLCSHRNALFPLSATPCVQAVGGGNVVSLVNHINAATKVPCLFLNGSLLSSSLRFHVKLLIFFAFPQTAPPSSGSARL